MLPHGQRLVVAAVQLPGLVVQPELGVVGAGLDGVDVDGVLTAVSPPALVGASSVDFRAAEDGGSERKLGEDEFRRIALVAKIDRAEGLIATYREHIAIYRQHLDVYHHLLGRIGERLGEPEQREPS